MNYEALGRYVEAKEQLALLEDDIADQIRIAQSVLEVLAREVPPTRKQANPQASAEKLRLVAARIADKLEEAEALAREANADAARCGKPALWNMPC